MEFKLGLPPILYLTLNATIRKECRELLLKLAGVNLNTLSEQTRAGVQRAARIEVNDADGNSEMPAGTAVVHPMHTTSAVENIR